MGRFCGLRSDLRSRGGPSAECVHFPGSTLSEKAHVEKRTYLAVNLADAASIFTIGGFGAATAAIWFAGRQLRTQAASQKLHAVLETNRLWVDVNTSMRSEPIAFPPHVLRLILRAYRENAPGSRPALPNHLEPATPIEMVTPFGLACLLPAGVTDPAAAPRCEREYSRLMLVRALVTGVVLTTLDATARGLDGPPALADVSANERVELSACLDALHRHLRHYVNRLNEVAELYEAGLLDRRLFLTKRNTTIIRQAFVVEPYILWWNTVATGRWGMRILSLARAARMHHWADSLQRQPLRLSVEPVALRPIGDYPGLIAQTGWIVGAGHEPEPRRVTTGIHLPRTGSHLMDGFSERDKREQNQLIHDLHLTPGDSAAAWRDLCADHDRQLALREELLRR